MKTTPINVDFVFKYMFKAYTILYKLNIFNHGALHWILNTHSDVLEKTLLLGVPIEATRC